MSSPANNHSSRGVTSVEIIIAFLISSFFIISIGFIFSRLVQVRQSIITNTNLQKTADQILMNFSQETRWANTIYTSTYPATDFYFASDTQSQTLCIRYRLIDNYLEKFSAVLDNTDCNNPTHTSDETVERLTPPAIQVDNFSVIKRSAEQTSPSFDIRLTLSIANSNLSYYGHTAITPRNL